jgi:trehalose 6-phosphate phosphatase
MKRLLTIAGRLALHNHVRLGALLAFDFDGTLAPICADPNTVQLPLTTHALLRNVASRFPCVVISGRARKDVRGRVADIPLLEVFGNHGVEPWYASQSHIDCVSRWREILARNLAAISGVHIEDKVYSLSVHYRHAAEQHRTHRAILEALATLQGARVVPGKKVCNVMPAHAVHKGTALIAAMGRFECERALFVGDDHTDEDVFASCKPRQVFGVRVGFSRSSQAGYYLSRQGEIDALLAAVLRS